LEARFSQRPSGRWPRGVIRVHAPGDTTALDLAAGVTAKLQLKASSGSSVELNGEPVPTSAATMPGYRNLEIGRAGHYDIFSK